MTAFDTTNLRINFTVPASGRVLVRIGVTSHGATVVPQAFLGVLEGATVKARVAAQINTGAAPLATTHMRAEAVFVVPGLTPGANLNWDAAWGVETGAASSNFKYGGPNDATANNAWGAFQYEIWEA